MAAFDVELTVRLCMRVENVQSAREAMDVVIDFCYGVPQEKIAEHYVVDVLEESAEERKER